MFGKLLKPLFFAATVLCVVALLAACEDTKTTEDATTTETTDSSSDNSALVNPPDLDMSLPDSLTGGAAVTSSLTRAVVGTQAASGGPDCEFLGNGEEDPFHNGYSSTRFLVGAVATWMCISNFLIEQIATLPLPTDGSIVDITDSDDPSGPTGIRIKVVSSTQTTLKLYFNDSTTAPGVYLSWNTASGTTEGRLVLASGFLNDGTKSDEPDAMRMDFTVTSDSRVADMFLSFPDNHPNMKGFRIKVSKDRTTGALPVFTALGRLDLSKQWDPAYQLAFPADAPPSLLLYTVSDGNGNGAAIASFADVGIGFDLQDPFQLGHLGFYKFTKDDKYVFDSLGASVWVDKNITSAIFENSTGGRDSTAANLDAIEGYLGLPADYFTATCVSDGNDCTVFLNKVFSDPDGANWGYEQNSGADPGDWRTAIINVITGTDYLPSICPDDAVDCVYDDTDVFKQSFTPGS